MRSIALVAVLAFGLAWAPLTAAEEILAKNKKEYLGWRKSETQFQPCSGKAIDLGEGEIRSTKDKCPGNPPIITVEGRVKNVDMSSSTVVLITTAGDARLYFASSSFEDLSTWRLPVAATASLQIEDLKVGMHVFAAGYVRGRADVVVKAMSEK